ncbi:TerB family tellurite resistance protein [Guyparkeria hydrothermalis]|uniref:tellurite resistance TerB family protein n=1 Tax=Guyparkeria hydrothermalis TaxID=923 RepID=UPI00202077EF|nr:TerB family tellurite resistance protein [Guyparkeria hydrothermalis]MCL7743736.1 TerB family tellurite resistance protein [Guyparkeria hydrothermalis]
MLKTLQSLFFPDEPASEARREMRVDAAVAILLMEVARADFDIADEELAVIRRTLVEDFDMSETDADDLVQHAAAEVDDSTGFFFPFVRLLNERLDPAAKCRVVETLWRVAYADAGKHHLEESTIRQISDLLYVSHSDFIRARVRAEEAAGSRGGPQ